MKCYFSKWTYIFVENQISLNQEIQSLECESVPVTKGDTIIHEHQFILAQGVDMV